jgi:hypothetical protein
MNKRQFLVLMAVFSLVFPLISYIEAGPTQAYGEDKPNSAEAPSGYTIQSTELDILPQSIQGQADILLIETSLPWNSNADKTVLNALGYTYDIATMSNIDSIDIFRYPVILVVNDQVQAFYDQYAERVTDFENYVKNGNTLLFFAASDGWARGTLQARLPGGVRITTPWYKNYNYIADPSHPIVNAQLSDGIPLKNADLYGTYCSHGYFTSLLPNTKIIFKEEGGFPTLIEYKYGKGRVIASTQTWEFHWDRYWVGNFSRKALDDVFLYAFSGGAVQAGVNIDLRVDDAPSWMDVNKSRGSYVDLVARVTGDSSYDAIITLQVPDNKLGTPTKTFTRNRSGDPVEGQLNQYSNPKTGQYRITSKLQPVAGNYYKEFVFRFKVPANASIERKLTPTATVSVSGFKVQNPVSTAKLNIIDKARSILVTNRRLLFNKYQPDPLHNDVTPLLERVNAQAWIMEGEIFYVDLYNSDARNWNQSIDYSSEAKANLVFSEIDGLIDSWYSRFSLSGIKPEFLLIIGGDEIIPFYRADDRLYDDSEKKIKIDDKDPVGKVPHQRFLLSDNPYADIGGEKSEWEEGKLELSVGRIVGHSADAMRQFIENASLKTPPLTHAVLASRSKDHNLDTVRDRLNSKNVAIYGEENPDLTENDIWTRDQWLSALQQPYQVLGYQGHGAFNAWSGTDKWNGVVTTYNHPSGFINVNHPLFVVAACNFAIPTDLDGALWKPEENDNISYKLVSLGAGGVVSSLGIHTTSASGVAYGEKIYNDYFKYLIDHNFNFYYSEYFGTALLMAKQYYTGADEDGLNSMDRKAVMEYVYYGLPWSFMETPENPEVQSFRTSKQIEVGYDVLGATPVLDDKSTYSRNITFTVPIYEIHSIDDFDLLSIPKSDAIYTMNKPVLPLLRTTLTLPPGSSVSNLEFVSEQSYSLGPLNIPAAEPISYYNDTTGFTTIMDVTGVFPEVRYGYDVYDMGDRVVVRIFVAPATFNVDTKEVILFDITEVKANYTAPVPLAFQSVVFDKPEYSIGETLTVFSVVDNVDPFKQTVSGIFSIYDIPGNLVGITGTNTFEIDGGTSQTLQIPWNVDVPPGNYYGVLTIQQNGTTLIENIVHFKVLGGKLFSFIVPETLKSGDYGSFSLTFTNFYPNNVFATAKVYIHNASGTKVFSLHERSLTLVGGATEVFQWLWDPTGLPTGDYFVQAVINAGNETYNSPLSKLKIIGSPTQVYLITPAESARLTTRKPEFIWSEVSGSPKYYLQISRNKSFSDLVVNRAVTSTTFLPSKNLPANTKLYWRVRAYVDGKYREWSEKYSFVIVSPPSKPVLLSPRGDKLVSTYTPKLDWRNSTLRYGSVFDHYQLQVADDSSFTVPVINISNLTRIDASEYSPTINLSPNTRYYWRVRAFNDLGQSSDWSIVQSFRTRMNTPILISPASDETIDNLRPIFSWSSTPEAVSYTISVSTKSDLTDPIITAYVDVTSYNCKFDLPEGKKLYWRVKADGANPSLWSTTWHLTTPKPPSIPTLVYPIDNRLITHYTPTFDWRNSTLLRGIEFGYYQIQVANSANFLTPEIDIVDLTDRTVSEYTLVTELIPNTKYYWRVRAFNSLGHYSTWSKVQTFRAAILPPTLVEPSKGSIAISLKPDFIWIPVDGATSYTIQVSLVPTFRELLASGNTRELRWTSSVNLPQNRTLYWRVQANGPNGPSLQSASSFTSANPPSTPGLISPENKTVIKTLKPRLDWSTSKLPPETEFEHYELQLAENYSFESPSTIYIEGQANSEYSMPDSLLQNKTYYWRVRAINRDGHVSNWSARWRFTTP